MKGFKTNNTVLLGASVAGVLALVAFQAYWILYSGRLSEEIFNQRASMALCSAMEQYEISCSKGEAQCCQLSCCTSDVVVQDTFAGDSVLRVKLRKALDKQQIALDFRLSLTNQPIANCSDRESYQCPLQVGTVENAATFVNLTFPDKKTFVWGKIGLMMLATILILLFITGVLLFANWSLARQKRLLQANVDFFNNMAHEFRTPLTNIGLAANMFSKKHPELADTPLIGIVKTENAKLMQQVERVLQLASVEHEGYVLQKENLPLHDLLQTVCNDMSMQVEERQATIDLSGVTEQAHVFGDRMHLSNIFRNLFENALKYSEEQPLIKCSATEQAKGILISVEDNGIGIPGDQCGFVFEKFQRVGNGNLHEQKGFGLGLAYVKAIVERHQGTVKVSSELTRGSRFDLFFPSATV